jgi:hypothetical protein
LRYDVRKQVATNTAHPSLDPGLPTPVPESANVDNTNAAREKPKKNGFRTSHPNPGRDPNPLADRIIPQLGGSQLMRQTPPSQPNAYEQSSNPILTYGEPFLPDEEHKNSWIARRRLFGNSLITALDVAAFQKELVYLPVYPWGRLLALAETFLTSSLFALFLLAVRRQFRR